jgi:predicted RNA-binding protein with PIN domain
MPYLIDGHNLIPKLGLRLDSPDDEMELVGIIQEFSRLSRREVQVYFDGAPAGEARTQRFGLVTAHFIRLGSTADAAIKAQLNRLGRAARNWTIVTSDREVQNAARAVHATVLSSDEFARRLKQLRRASDRPSGDMQLSPDEIVEWLNLFNKKN